MKYKCGMYGGSFNPLHMGHVGCIVTASCQCERLIIVISNGLNRDEIDVRLRYRWIYQMTKHESCGFRMVGYRERLGRDRFGVWRNTVLMEKRSASDCFDRACTCGAGCSCSSEM